MLGSTTVSGMMEFHTKSHLTHFQIYIWFLLNHQSGFVFLLDSLFYLPPNLLYFCINFVFTCKWISKSGRISACLSIGTSIAHFYIAYRWRFSNVINIQYFTIFALPQQEPSLHLQMEIWNQRKSFVISKA